MTSKGKNILVTGANGLIGYSVATELARQGRPVVGFVRSRPLRDQVNFDTYEGDLTDIHRIHGLFKRYSIDSIIHSAAVSGPMLARDNPYTLCLTNIMGTANILEAARMNGVRRVVYTSSSGAYGDTPLGLVREETPLRPKNVYGATKASGEHLIRAYAVQNRFEGVSLRICWVFGPRRRTACLIRTMIEDALEGRSTRLGWGLGLHRQYIYIDDVVSAIIAALDVPSLPKEAYNVTGGTYLTIDQIAEVVKSVLPGAEIHLSPGPDPVVDTIQGEYDISAIKRDLGFSPRFSLKQGIEIYSRWFSGQRAVEI
jgi:UDP-glucuronate 4-epimerase